MSFLGPKSPSFNHDQDTEARSAPIPRSEIPYTQIQSGKNEEKKGDNKRNKKKEGGIKRKTQKASRIAKNGERGKKKKEEEEEEEEEDGKRKSATCKKGRSKKGRIKDTVQRKCTCTRKKGYPSSISNYAVNGSNGKRSGAERQVTQMKRGAGREMGAHNSAIQETSNLSQAILRLSTVYEKINERD